MTDYCSPSHLAGGGTQTGPGNAYEGSTRQGIFGGGQQANTGG